MMNRSEDVSPIYGIVVEILFFAQDDTMMRAIFIERPFPGSALPANRWLVHELHTTGLQYYPKSELGADS